LKQRHASFTRTAQEHVAREKAWWLENRDHTDIFAEELEQALSVIAILPGAGPGAFLDRASRHTAYPPLRRTTANGISVAELRVPRALNDRRIPSSTDSSSLARSSAR
jgi:hypothetical protein